MCRFFLLILIVGCAWYALPAQPRFDTQLLDDDIAIGYGLAIGDVDGDQQPDILLADKEEFVWYRNGDWKRHVMVRDLTDRDNVCIAAEDIDGDGQVEVAVGGQWNPGETSDYAQSGSVHYLIRPEDPTQPWEAVSLPHVPTIHRMRWVKMDEDQYQLVVLPLHGIGNQSGEGAGVQVMAFKPPKNPRKKWKYRVLDQSMHMTHNFDHVEIPLGSGMYIGGKEGVKHVASYKGKWLGSPKPVVSGHGFGEVRIGNGPDNRDFLAGIEPMHGNILSIYALENGMGTQRQVLTEDLNQGHALACADLLGMGQDQVVVGWRTPNDEGKVGVRIYVPQQNGGWAMHLIDDNGMAAEDLKVADLNGDGKPDIIACGRATRNLKIYWNKN